MLRLASTIVAASIALAPHTVAARLDSPKAEESEALARAEALRQEAIEAFTEGDLQVAVEKFELAYEADPSPAYLFNIGRVYEEMGQLEKALDNYERFSRQPRLTLEERAKAAERIEVLRTLVGDDPATDTNDSGRSGGETAEPTGSTTPGTDDRGEPGKNARVLLIAGSSVLGAGAAIALGGGLGLGLAARNRSNRVSEIAAGQNPEGLSLTEVEDLDAQGRTFELYQLMTAIAGGGLVVVGAALVGVGMSRRAKGKARSARVQPVLGRNVAGLVIQGRF